MWPAPPEVERMRRNRFFIDGEILLAYAVVPSWCCRICSPTPVFISGGSRLITPNSSPLISSCRKSVASISLRLIGFPYLLPVPLPMILSVSGIVEFLRVLRAQRTCGIQENEKFSNLPHGPCASESDLTAGFLPFCWFTGEVLSSCGPSAPILSDQTEGERSA